MNVQQLCEKISLPSEVRSRLADCFRAVDFGAVDGALRDFLVYEKIPDACAALQEKLGDDEDHMKMLACMLQASANAYAVYRERGVDDGIYVATMKCYTRFLNETHQMTGRYDFDRYGWTGRQAGCHLFRIGQLEYEISPRADRVTIEIHIPSDADFSPAAVEESLKQARAFFARYDPQLSHCAYCCRSWLLDRQLRGMLGKDSHILSFQNRFTIFDEGEAGADVLRWLFQTQETCYEALPERTSLQRKVKMHLLSGGVIRNAGGILCKP